MTGLLDERRGRKGPVKLTTDVHAFLDGLGPPSVAEAAVAVADQLGVILHPRTIHGAGADQPVLAACRPAPARR